MREEEKVLQLLKDGGISAAGAIVANPSVESGYFVPLRLSYESDGTKTPSGRTLATVKENGVRA